MIKDKIIQDAINAEAKRQGQHIELIASENYVSEDVLEVTGSILTNKYAEGYPGKRYYDGTEFVDIIENEAIDRLKKLFGVKFANVQPHSGSQANAAAIMALINPGDLIMGLSLPSGGHLTHGYKINFSGKIYKSVNYEVDENGYLDFDAIEKIAVESNPDLIICGFSAYSRNVDFKAFKKIADKVGAYLIADVAHIAGLIVAGQHESPVGYADVITSTTHKTLRGARGGIIMTNDPLLAKKVNSAVFPGQQGGPLLHSIAGKAVAFREALKPEFKTYVKNLVENSKTFADELMKLGVSIVSGGTDNHLFTFDVKKTYGLTGKAASEILQKNFITVNKNTIPNDTESPFVTSGIRVGTAAMTSRDFGKKEFIELAHLIDTILKDPTISVKKQVLELTEKFPIKKQY